MKKTTIKVATFLSGALFMLVALTLYGLVLLQEQTPTSEVLHAMSL